MKCKKFGVITLTGINNPTTVNISNLNLESEEDYMIILSGDGINGNAGAWISAKSKTSFSVVQNITQNSITLSYQVITFK